MNETDPKTCSEHGDALIWEPGGDDMPTVYGRWYCPSCQRQLMAALDASGAREVKQGLVEQPTASEPVWLDCTCGHPYDDHGIDGCCFPACGCARSGQSVQPTASAGDVESLAAELAHWWETWDGRPAYPSGQMFAEAVLESDWLADVRREERERVLGEVEQWHLDHWYLGGATNAALAFIREARGGAR